MNITTRDRSDLKQYFVRNAIPTQSNFAELIDAGFNQRDDGIAKPPGDPLSIEASGDATTQRKVVNFYENFTDQSATWVLSLNPRSDPFIQATARAGFSISDGAGNSRLFIDKASGNVGIGTTAPGQKLTVAGIVESSAVGIRVTNPTIDLAIGDSDTGLKQQGAGELAIMTNSEERVRITNSGNVGLGTTSPGAKLEVNGNVKVTGVIEQEDWQSFTLVGGWVNYDVSNYNAAGYFKDSMGIVHLRGLVTNSGNYSIAICELPEGYRPPAIIFFPCVDNKGVASLGQIYSTGDIVVSNAFISLEGITFRPA